MVLARRSSPLWQAESSLARYAFLQRTYALYSEPSIKYNGGSIPADSRFDNHKDFFKQTIENFGKEEGKARFLKVDKLIELATELDCKVSHLALAWIAKKPYTSTVILGASRPEQVLDNLKALEVIPKLTPEIEARIEAILANAPEPEVGLFLLLSYNRTNASIYSPPLVAPPWTRTQGPCTEQWSRISLVNVNECMLCSVVAKNRKICEFIAFGENREQSWQRSRPRVTFLSSPNLLSPSSTFCSPSCSSSTNTLHYRKSTSYRNTITAHVVGRLDVLHRRV